MSQHIHSILLSAEGKQGAVLGARNTAANQTEGLPLQLALVETTVLEAGSQKSRRQRGQVPVRALSGCRLLTSPCILT